MKDLTFNDSAGNFFSFLGVSDERIEELNILFSESIDRNIEQELKTGEATDEYEWIKHLFSFCNTEEERLGMTYTVASFATENGELINP